MTPHAAIFLVTAYSWGCGASIWQGSGLTRGETVPTVGRTIASDWRVLPRGASVVIQGVGVRRVEDTGRSVRGHHIDLLVGSCEEARKWGRKKLRVTAFSTGQKPGAALHYRCERCQRRHNRRER